MSLDYSFVEQNRASVNRIRHLVNRLTEAEWQQPVGEHWTVAIALAHITFWDRRMVILLDETERAGKLVIPQLDILINDVLLPMWAAIPPHEVGRLAVATAEFVDQRLEHFPPALLEEIWTLSDRFIIRAGHRHQHLDEIEAALS